MRPQELRVPSDLDLFPAEVKQLALFVRGSMMDVGVRQHLWRSWGFCPRHAWGHAIVEIELVGGHPFGTAILYEDLMGRAARSARGTHGDPSALLQELTPRDFCFTCDYISFAHTDRFVLKDTERANRHARTHALLRASSAMWLPRVCPACRSGTNGVPCRWHLACRIHQPPPDLDAELSAISRRLYAHVKSLTVDGPPADDSDRVAWIEALGFMAGWNVPLALVGDD